MKSAMKNNENIIDSFVEDRLKYEQYFQNSLHLFIREKFL